MRTRLFIILLGCTLTAVFSLSCVDNFKPADERTGGAGKVEDGTAAGVFLGSPPVIINEINLVNDDYRDEFDKTPGWVEFYNPADTAFNLRGYGLTNNADNRMWEFGDVVVAPRGYLTVFMSGRSKPDLEPPRDSMDLLAASIGAWAWADSLNTPTRGRSSAYYQFGSAGISGTLNMRDNGGFGGLGWSSAVVMLALNGWDTTEVVDMSRTNQVLLRGSLGKGSALEVRFCHMGVAEHQAWPAVITGTGAANDLYIIDLPSVDEGFPDLKNIYGIRFSSKSSFRGTINFAFNSIIAQNRGSNVHVSFSLSSGGGRLFLTDQSGNIRDSVAYPAGARGLSYAKNSETGLWTFSKPPTPNALNSPESYDGQVQPPPSAGLPRSGYFENSLSFTLPAGTDNSVLCCDTSGRLPTAESSLKSGTALSLTRTTVLRCAQFKPGSYASEPVLRTYIIGEREPALPVVSIAVDPVDMFDNTVGLYATGPNASAAEPYYGANYWAETELPIHIDFFEGGARHAWSHPAGLRIMGNWSRANAKKSVKIAFRNMYGGPNRLTYPLFPDFPALTRFKHFCLRNNGNNFPNDYIRDMLMTSLTEGLGIDYQKGRATIVYYNGQYFGIHNLRERSNGDYFETNYGVSEDFIDLIKVDGEVSNGSDVGYQEIVRWLEGVTLTDENLRALEQRIDVDNFTNNFQCRIYYNDRDWPGNNMKRWRFNAPPTKWKWFMYDTDHGWGGYGIYEQPNLGALAFAARENGPSWPNPPHSTFMLRKLLTNESYKHAFINRFSLLIATYFAPTRVAARIDALMAPIQSEIQRDQQRWRHSVTRMSEQMGVIRNFGNTRPGEMQREIETFFGLGSGSADFTVSVSGSSGKVQVHGLDVLNGSAKFKAYASVPVTLKAVAGPGAEFDRWSDGMTDAERTVTVTNGQPLTLQANFKGVPISVKPVRGRDY